MKNEDQLRKWIAQFGTTSPLPEDGQWILLIHEEKLFTGPADGESYMAGPGYIVNPNQLEAGVLWAPLPMQVPDPPPEPKGPRVFPVAAALVRRVHDMMDESVEAVPWARRVLDGISARFTFGLSKYGQTLHRDDGRERDIEDELFDWFVYMVRHLMRREDPRRYTNFMRYLADMIDFMWGDEHFEAEMATLERDHG